MSIFKQKKGLGRGISSLIGDAKNTSVKNKISISEIVRGKYQPRKIFNKESLEELSNSIRAVSYTHLTLPTICSV